MTVGRKKGNEQGQSYLPTSPYLIPLTSYPIPFPYFCSMPKIKIRIINQSSNALPGYATVGAAGMDLMANIQEPLSLGPLKRALVPTGLFIELPEGYEAQVRPRSGLAIKHGITCLNSPGTIDSDYRGELQIILVNLSDQEHVIKHGDRIAQMVVHKVEKIEWDSVNKIGVTARNEGGFGHTGK